MTQTTSQRVALFGRAPSIQQLIHGQYQFVAAEDLLHGPYNADATQTEILDLVLPNTVGHTLLVGRIELRESTTDCWVVSGEREGQTLKPDRITEYVFGGRGGVIGEVLWQHEAEREQQTQSTTAASRQPGQHHQQFEME